MKALQFLGLPEQYTAGTQRLLQQKGCCMAETGFPVQVILGQTLSVRVGTEEATITYPQGFFFRALGLLLAHVEEAGYWLTETPVYRNLGVQLDLSRNGAMKVEAIRSYMDYMALMGYNQLYLYLEDMFCVPGRAYFGYLRGRYSPEELKALDDYAFDYGIELIPSIQALGHHEQYLRWDESADVRDTADELLADCETTYAFIEDMIRAVTAPLRSKKIVLGLDEAHTLGLGQHLRRFGYEAASSIFSRHLKKVFAITDGLGLEGMLYVDMYFRMFAPDHGYYTESTVIPPEVAQEIPENATLIYWHYGEEPGCDDYMLQKCEAMGRKTVFFGGTWNWSGHLPNTAFAMQMTKDALVACKKHQIQEVIQTLWGDDSNECDAIYGLLTLQYTAELAFDHDDQTWLEERFRFCTGGNAKAFYDMTAYQNIFDRGVEYGSFLELFRGKALFWQDIMLGQADDYLHHTPMSGYYGEFADRFAAYRKDISSWSKHYGYIEDIFRYLSLKCSIAERLTDAYKAGDRQTLERICGQLTELLVLTERCHVQHKALWMESCKPFGWEVLDNRYGGMAARIRTAQERIRAYLDDSISRLEELEEARLPMTPSPWTPFRRIASATVRY